MKIGKTFFFESAHFLPKVADSHKCKRMHGHNYRVDVILEGPVGEDGFVVDFADIAAAMRPLIASVDHRCLNEVEGLENPTAENIAVWFWDRLVALPNLSLIRVYETAECWAEHDGT